VERIIFVNGVLLFGHNFDFGRSWLMQLCHVTT
jgi:hypothetical protein